MPNLLLGVLRPALLAPPPTAGIAGYFAQGDESDNVFRTDFPTDSWSTFQLLAPSTAGAGLANSGVAGYIHRGLSDEFDPTDVMEKITLPTDSVSAITTIEQLDGFGFGDPGNIGVWGEGAVSETSTGSDVIGSFSFAVDTITNVDVGIIDPADGLGGGCDPGVAGYYPINFDTLIGELLLPTLTATLGVAFSPSGVLEAIFGTVWVNAGVALYATRGLDAGPPFGEETDEVRKVAFPVDAAMAAIAGMPEPSAFGGAFSNDGVAAYANKGGPFLEGASDKVFKLAYATDTWTTTTALPGASTDNGAFANMG